MKIHKLFYFKFICIVAITLVLTWGGGVALAATPSPLEQATVNLYCRLSAGKYIYTPTGSGVFISDRGVILTGAHVAQYFLLAKAKGKVSGRCYVRTGSPAKDAYSADILYIPPVWLEENVSQISKRKPKGNGENDFALIYVTGAKKGKLPPAFPYISLSVENDLQVGEEVKISGYPSGGLTFDEAKKKLAKILASSDISEVRSFDNNNLIDAFNMLPSAASKSGISGGPVVDSSGSLIGIAIAKLGNEDNTTLRAITTSYIKRMLQAQTGSSLASIIASDLTLRSATTKSLITPEVINSLTNGLRRKK